MIGVLSTAHCSLPTAFLLAPIRGVTDAVYRDAFASCFGGFDYAVSPFLQLRQGHPLRSAELRQIAMENNRALRTIPQVLTNHAPTFSAALRELSEAGHEEVNWNLGCPYPTVAGRGRGAGLLPDATRIDRILEEVLKDTSVRLSVKMRLGLHNPDEFQAVMEVLNRYPLTEVILHARTADQMYEGGVDLARARQALELCRHPFVYNGDIATVDGWNVLEKQLPGVAGWMIGRSALRNPFLAAQIKAAAPLPSPDVRRERLIKFHDLLFEGYGQWLSGDQHRLDKMLAQWEYLAHAFADPHAVYSRVRRSHAGNYMATVKLILTPHNRGCD
ncbi:MAG: tRNA-dihydrouridine synthase family protein [bacterium]